jgi:hypothetical protein
VEGVSVESSIRGIKVRQEETKHRLTSASHHLPVESKTSYFPPISNVFIVNNLAIRSMDLLDSKPPLVGEELVGDSGSLSGPFTGNLSGGMTDSISSIWLLFPWKMGVNWISLDS